MNKCDVFMVVCTKLHQEGLIYLIGLLVVLLLPLPLHLSFLDKVIRSYQSRKVYHDSQIPAHIWTFLCFQRCNEGTDLLISPSSCMESYYCLNQDYSPFLYKHCNKAHKTTLFSFQNQWYTVWNNDKDQYMNGEWDIDHFFQNRNNRGNSSNHRFSYKIIAILVFRRHFFRSKQNLKICFPFNLFLS